MADTSINRLNYLLDIIPDKLRLISEEEFSRVPAPGKWCKKEIIGHLIDSATNNHQRFIRLRYENVPHLVYHTDKWVELSDYRNMNSRHLIDFWELYNRHLVYLIKNISSLELEKKGNTGEKEPVTLDWLIDDYIRHLEHHLHQLTDYN